MAIRAAMQAWTVRSKMPAEPLGAPALPDAGQRGMIGQRLVQPVAREPADGEVDLRLPHQPPVMDDAQQEARQHQAHRDLRVDAGPTVVGAVEVGDLVAQPAEVQDPVDRARM